jgi:hypothetical protein
MSITTDRNYVEAPRPIPKAAQEVLRKQLQDMARRGIIEPSTSNWSMGVLVVAKKPLQEGAPLRYRFCLDARPVNMCTAVIKWPLSPIQDTLTSMAGATYITAERCDRRIFLHQATATPS